MEFQPDCLQMCRFRITEVSHRFYFLPVKIIFHHAVENSVLSFAIPVDKQSEQLLKSVILYFTQL